MEDPVTCEHADRCGGCPAIHLAYGEQLALKRGRVVQALARYPSLELVYADPVLAAESTTQYRTRAKLIVGPHGAVGLFAKGGGHDVVDVPRCRVLSPVVGRVVASVRTYETAAQSAGTHPPIAGLRAIDVRELTGGVAPRALLTLVVSRSSAGDLALLRTVGARLLAEIPELVGVAASLHDGDSPQVLGSETVLLAGAASAADRVGECAHVATFGSFVQAHRAQAVRIHELIAASLGIGKAPPPAQPPRVLDLYAGSGAIALALARRGADVTCVEAFGPAAARIEEAAAHNELRIRSIHSDVASALRTAPDQAGLWDAIVVNPPRRGVGPVARMGLARMRAPVIAYVSCDPDTLTRDLDHLARLGYRCASAQPLDMIPLSDEVETVAILRRAPPSAARVLYEDAQLLFVEKAPHEPMTPSKEHAGSLIERVQRLPNAQAAVPVTKLDVGTSGVVLFTKTPAGIAALDHAVNASATRHVYLVGTRGVTPTKGSIARGAAGPPSSVGDRPAQDDPAMQRARTKYRRLAIFAGHGVARVMPDGGRGHQIRRHFASIGHPVLGDDRHGHASTNRHFEEKYGLDRTFLHCVRVELDHPQTGVRLVVESALPGDLASVLDRAGGPGTLRLLEQKNALGRATSSVPPPPSGPMPARESQSTSDGRLLRADIVSEEDDPHD
jgi:23S rRNA (uracil1939-C5)-methyltransferase